MAYQTRIIEDIAIPGLWRIQSTDLEGAALVFLLWLAFMVLMIGIASRPKRKSL